MTKFFVETKGKEVLNMGYFEDRPINSSNKIFILDEGDFDYFQTLLEARCRFMLRLFFKGLSTL